MWSSVTGLSCGTSVLVVESSYPKEALPPLAGFDRERDGVVNIANNPGQVDEHLLPTSSQVSGREPYPGRSAPRTLQVPGVPPGQRSTAVMYCEGAPAGTPTLTPKSGWLPFAQEKGLVAPRTSHDDVVLDVKVTELPTKTLLSGRRDGAVKIWK